jgi:hypothetical protein
MFIHLKSLLIIYILGTAVDDATSTVGKKVGVIGGVERGP